MATDLTSNCLRRCASIFCVGSALATSLSTLERTWVRYARELARLLCVLHIYICFHMVGSCSKLHDEKLRQA